MTTDKKTTFGLKTSYFDLLPNIEEKKRQTYSTLIFTIVALSFFGLFAINPTLSTIANLQKQVSDSQQVQQTMTQKISDLTVLKNQYDQLSDSLPIINNAIPQQPAITDIAGKIQTIAQTVHVSINRYQSSSVHLIPNLPTTSTQSYTFTLGATGTSDNIKQFLNLLSSFDRIITIDTVTVSLNIPSAQTQGTQAQSVTGADISGQVYFMP